MIEQTVLNYLKKKLSSPVKMEEPSCPPDTFVLVEKVGSRQQNSIDTAMLAVKSYAKSLFEAALLNEEVKKAMSDLTELDEICRVELNSDYNFTDTATRRYRYQAVFDITHY